MTNLKKALQQLDGEDGERGTVLFALLFANNHPDFATHYNEVFAEKLKQIMIDFHTEIVLEPEAENGTL